MEIKIDEDRLGKFGMSIPEVLVMKALHEHCDISDVFDSLQNTEYINGFINGNVSFVTLTKNGLLVLGSVVTQKDDNNEVLDDKSRLLEIATAMREAYPIGYKKTEGPNGGFVDGYPWRGSCLMTADRLRKFENIFGVKLNFEDAVEATKRYVEVETRKDPYVRKSMKLLKYFIYKKKDNGEIESSLMEYLETEIGEEFIDESNGMTIL